MTEYDTVVNKMGGFGKYQKMILLLLSISPIFNALTTFAMNFTFGEHKHRCEVPGGRDEYTPTGYVIVNDTATSSIYTYNVTECKIQTNGSVQTCDTWVYDHSLYTQTIISKFDVVCEAKFLRAHFLMSHYLGLLVGSVITGLLSDIFGRKPMLFIGAVTLLVATSTRPLMPSLTLVIIGEFFNGVGSVMYFIVPFVLATEMVGPNKRLFASFCVYFTFCFGSYALLILAYFIRNWEHLMWAMSIPIGGYILALFFIPESPRWLLSRGKKKEAVVILKKIAKVNGEDIIVSVEDISVSKGEKILGLLQFVKALMKSKIMIVRLSIVALNWFAVNLTYYGISMNVAKFSGNIFVNFAVSSTVETVACLFCMMGPERFGRKKFLCISMLIGGSTCLCTIFTTLYSDESLSWLTITLAMGGKFFATITFFVVYLITAELFPTVLRTSVIGVCSMAGRTGSITSAYVGEIGSVVPTKLGKALPLMIFGAVEIMAGILALTLPETVNTSLPESVEDAKVLKSAKNENGEPENELMTLTDTNKN